MTTKIYFYIKKDLVDFIFYYLRSCIVHVDNIMFFICPNNAHNSYKIVKHLKTFKIIIVAPSCFGLHWATIPITSNNELCNRYQHCNFSEAHAESSLMMVYVNRNMSEQLL